MFITYLDIACIHEGWSTCADVQMGLLVDMVGLEGKVARGRVKASFAPVSGLFLSCLGGCLKSGRVCANVQMGSLWTWSD